MKNKAMSELIWGFVYIGAFALITLVLCLLDGFALKVFDNKDDEEELFCIICINSTIAVIALTTLLTLLLRGKIC